MPAPEIIHQLVAKFEENRDAYRSGKYNEARLRQDFLDKFFIALGWDVGNEKGFAPEYAEVEIEASLDIEGTSKSPDYAFKIGRERKFYVEAKKPAVNIQYDIHPAFQLRRYAWNAKLPLSILTDFEELAVYNCKTRPNPTDYAATGRDLFFKYSEYVERWDEIAAIFSRDAVWKGALDRYADASKGKKGTTAVDDEFLKDMNEWRINLARNIALRNPQIADEHQLNYAVQMTIDRVIFLRICEDRGIEPEEQLKNLAATPGVYPRLVELFRRADVRYNSGLFHFNHEKSVSTAPDTFTPTLTIDDKVLKEFIKDIYYPCPYIFKEIPVEILGQVYEQFLGQVIRLTAGHQAKVEEKPEVRKAGGVYYTPKYIVDYIVANTLGKLLEGKTPVEAAALKIVDPACGSGSFLLGAFQYLIDWHEKWYLDDDPAKWTKGKAPALNEVTTLPGGSAHGYRLTTLKKKEILLNNIHGVDIDAQAVEVTKLSLLLKVLEEETGQLSLGLERALPDLGRNIQCGNSLIGEDYFVGQLPLQGASRVVDPAERRRVNPFEWERAFPEVFGQGGFDAVIGNPPYIRIQSMKEWAPNEIVFYKKRYKSAGKGNYDIYVIFVEKGITLLNKDGYLGYILPHKFFNSIYGEPLRGIISETKNLKKIVHFGDKQVFFNATTYTCLFFLTQTPQKEFEFVSVDNIDEWKISNISKRGFISTQKVTNLEWNFVLGKEADLFEKLNNESTQLANVVTKIYQGPITSADDVYLFKDYKSQSSEITQVFSKALDKWVDIESPLLKKVIRSGSIGRYWVKQTACVLFPYYVDEDAAELISINNIKKNFPLAFEYLMYNKKQLESRENNAFKDSTWYRFGRNQNLGLWEQPKLLIPYMVNKLSSYYDTDEEYYFINVTTGGYGIRVNQEKIQFSYLCGLLNSKLLDFFLKRVSTTFHGGYFAANKQYIEKLPIHVIDQSNMVEINIHKKIISLVDCLLDLHKQTPATPQEQEQLRREIESTDRQIDQLVYQLYGLTDEEIRIVEGG